MLFLSPSACLSCLQQHRHYKFVVNTCHHLKVHVIFKNLFFFFFSIFFLYFFFPGEQAGCDTKSVHVFVCVYTGSSIQAEAPTNTHDLQHLHFHESIGPTQQIQNSVIQGKNVTEVHFRSIFSLASQLPSCLHIYTNLALDKLSMILLLRNVMLCLLCMMC